MLIFRKITEREREKKKKTIKSRLSVRMPLWEKANQSNINYENEGQEHLMNHLKKSNKFCIWKDKNGNNLDAPLPKNE